MSEVNVLLESEQEGMGGFLVPRTDGKRRTQVSIQVTKPKNLAKPEEGAALDRPKGFGKGKKHKLACLGISKDILDKGDPRYANSIRLANSFRKHRQKELLDAHGYVSAGATALLAASALALAASRFLYEKVAETGNLELLHMAGKLSNDARQNELAAWELCSREAIARRKMAAGRVDSPWLTTLENTTSKPGRKSNAQKIVETTYQLTEGDSDA